MLILFELPSNQSLYRQITGYRMSVGWSVCAARTAANFRWLMCSWCRWSDDETGWWENKSVTRHYTWSCIVVNYSLGWHHVNYGASPASWLMSCNHYVYVCACMILCECVHVCRCAHVCDRKRYKVWCAYFYNVQCFMCEYYWLYNFEGANSITRVLQYVQLWDLYLCS